MLKTEKPFNIQLNTLNQFLSICLFMLVTGYLALIWNLSNNNNITPEAIFSQLLSSFIGFLLLIGLTFLISYLKNR